MHPSAIRVKDVQITFTNERFRIPFKLSSGQITDLTYAYVELIVENRMGSIATGCGGILLSDLWAFPTPSLSHDEKDSLMRQLVRRFQSALLEITDYLDPFQFSHQMEQSVTRYRHVLSHEVEQSGDNEVPQLASLVCWSPFDAAIHDGWGRAAGRSVYDMYTKEFMNDDLGAYLGPAWRGWYPNMLMGPRKPQLWVQHVVGASDPLTALDRPAGLPNDGIPVTLEEWIGKERLRWMKLKVKGADPDWDLRRILDVYRVADEAAKRSGIKGPLRFEIDPNEGCSTPEQMVELLHKLAEHSPAVYNALIYIEQPTPRRLTDYTYTLHEISSMKPVLVDESLEDMHNLDYLEKLGWSGVALKTCKGQTHALLAYCWAKRRGLFITVQDLTNPGYALVQSAHLAARLSSSCDCVEANARQYIPFSRPEERERYPGLFVVKDGKLDLSKGLEEIGLY